MFKVMNFLIEYGVYLVTFLTPLVFMKNTKVNFLLPKEAFLGLMIPLLFWLWMSREIFTGLKSPRRYNHILIPLLLYVFSIIISWTNTPILSFSIDASFKAFIYPMFFLIIFFTFKKTSSVENTVFLMITAGGLVALYGILQYFRIDPFFRVGEVQGNVGKMEVFSTFGNPNFLSPYLAATLPFSIAWIFHNWGRKTWISLYSAALSCIIFICLLLAFARSSWVAMFLSALFMLGFTFFSDHSRLRFFFTRKMLISYTVFLVICTVFLGVFLMVQGEKSGKGFDSIKYYIKDRFTSMLNVYARFMMWIITLGEVKNHPFIGHGMFSFKLLYPEMQGRFYEDPENYKKWYYYGVAFRHAHNDFVQTIFELGFLGLGSFLAMAFIFFYQIFRLLKKDPANYYLYLGLLGGAIGVLGDGLTNFPFRRAAPQLAYYTSLAFAAFLYSQKVLLQKEPEDSDEFNAMLIPVSGILLIPFIFWIRTHSFNYLTANQYLKAGYVSLVHWQNPDQSLNFFAESARLQPEDPELWYWWAMAYVWKKDLVNAEKYMHKAQKYGSNNLIYYQLGLIYLQMNERDKAIENLKKSVQLIPLFADGYLQLGNIYINIGQPEEAIKWLEKIEGLSTRDTDDYSMRKKSHYLLFHCHFALQHYTEAMKYADKYLPYADQSEKEKLLVGYMQLLDLLKYSDEEKVRIMDSLEIQFPKTVFFDERIASVYFKAQKYDRSLPFWERHISETGQRGKMYYNIAACYFYLKNYEKAQEMIEKSLLYDPEFQSAKELLLMLKQPVPVQQSSGN